MSREDMTTLELLSRAATDLAQAEDGLDTEEKQKLYRAENLIYEVIQSKTAGWHKRNAECIKRREGK